MIIIPIKCIFRKSFSYGCLKYFRDNKKIISFVYFTLPELPSPTRTIFTCFSYVSPSESDIFPILKSNPSFHKRFWLYAQLSSCKKSTCYHKKVITLVSTSIFFKRHLSKNLIDTLIRIYDVLSDRLNELGRKKNKLR